MMNFSTGGAPSLPPLAPNGGQARFNNPQSKWGKQWAAPTQPRPVPAMPAPAAPPAASLAPMQSAAMPSQAPAIAYGNTGMQTPIPTQAPAQMPPGGEMAVNPLMQRQPIGDQISPIFGGGQMLPPVMWR